MSIEQNLNQIICRIRAAEERAGRAAGSVRLVAVSKTFPAADVRTAYDAGHRLFGENKVQEGIDKIRCLPPDTEWHLIGPLQRNKARKAIERFHMIHAVDSLRLAQFMDTVARELNKRPRILLEVNVGAEESKFGFSVEQLEADLPKLSTLQNLEIAGLMCIPPPVEQAEDARPYFRRMRELRDALAARCGLPLPELSMGMSHDFEIAVEEGATLVRVGTAIFGGRTYAV